MSYCPTCKKDVEGDICPNCGTPTESAKGKRPVVRRLSLAPAESTGADLAPYTPAPEPQPEAEERKPEPGPHNLEPPPPPRTQESAGGRSTSVVRAHHLDGEAELETFLAQGYEIFLIAGIEGVGKTELLSSFQQDGFLNLFTKQDGRALPTAPRTLNCHNIDFGYRKILFVDASGEHFRLLYSDVQTGVDIQDHISFLKLIARGLRGLVLLVELERLWDKRVQKRPEDAKQVEVLAWTLSLLRWLTSGGQYNREKNPIKFAKQVNADLMTMRRRLRVPVQVLYSKADQLADFLIPPELQGASRLQQRSAPPRRLLPVGEEPLFFTRHCLRELYNAIDRHADYYRFDFAHSLVTSQGLGTVSDSDPCGVALSIQWLLDPCWSSRFTPVISTRRWVALQRSLDKVVGRGRRWARLPDPKEISA